MHILPTFISISGLEGVLFPKINCSCGEHLLVLPRCGFNTIWLVIILLLSQLKGCLPAMQTVAMKIVAFWSCSSQVTIPTLARRSDHQVYRLDLPPIISVSSCHCHCQEDQNLRTGQLTSLWFWQWAITVIQSRQWILSSESLCSKPTAPFHVGWRM